MTDVRWRRDEGWGLGRVTYVRCIRDWERMIGVVRMRDEWTMKYEWRIRDNEMIRDEWIMRDLRDETYMDDEGQ